MQIVISDRGPRGGNVVPNPSEPSHPVAQSLTEPSPAPTFQLPVGTTPPITSATPAESGNMEMTIQQFTRRYLELDGRYAEQKAFLKRADRKRVQWKVIFTSPLTHFADIVVYLDVPAELPNEKPFVGGPVRWASFPLNLRDRIYSLKRGDTIEISGVLRTFERSAFIEGDDFSVVATPALTPTPQNKKSHHGN